MRKTGMALGVPIFAVLAFAKFDMMVLDVFMSSTSLSTCLEYNQHHGSVRERAFDRDAIVPIGGVRTPVLAVQSHCCLHFWRGFHGISALHGPSPPCSLPPTLRPAETVSPSSVLEQQSDYAAGW